MRVKLSGMRVPDCTFNWYLELLVFCSTEQMGVKSGDWQVIVDDESTEKEDANRISK